MLSWQYMDIYIYTCIPAHLWTYSVKGNLWCLQPDPPRHGHCNVSFCLSVTLPSNGKIPGFHRLSYTEFSACPMWLLKKKKTVRLSFKGGSACIAPVSWVCFSMIVYYQYTLSGLFQSLPIMNGLVCSSVLGQFEYSFFVRYALF